MAFGAGGLLHGKFREMPSDSDKKGAPTEICAPKNANPDCCETNVTDWGYKSLSTLHGGICIFTKFSHVRVDKKESMYSFRKKTYTPVIRLFRKFSIPQNALQVKRESLISGKLFCGAFCGTFLFFGVIFLECGRKQRKFVDHRRFFGKLGEAGCFDLLDSYRASVDTAFLGRRLCEGARTGGSADVLLTPHPSAIG